MTSKELFINWLGCELVFIGATSKISLQARTAQRLWIEKVQERVRLISDFLGDIKAIKMLGLSPVVSTVTQNLRMDEIRTSKSFRKLLIATLMFCMCFSFDIT